MKYTTALLLSLLLIISTNAQNSEKEKIALLPLISNGIDPDYSATTESILRMELGKETNMKVITEKNTLEAIGEDECFDEECASETGRELGADKVLVCKISPLGEKLIVQYILVETVSGELILSEQATAVNLEDLDAVMKRVAISVAYLSPFDENQEVGNIVGQESIEDLQRASRYNFGLGFGYLFPTSGYNEDKDKSFTVNVYFDYELEENYAVGLMFGARSGIAANLYGNYLFSKTDFAPYVGGALGFHWISHNDFYRSDKEGDGIEVGLEAGIRLFHTYSFQMFVKCEYIMTFNDYHDRAIVFTIGIL